MADWLLRFAYEIELIFLKCVNIIRTSEGNCVLATFSWNEKDTTFQRGMLKRIQLLSGKSYLF